MHLHVRFRGKHGIGDTVRRHLGEGAVPFKGT